MRGSSGEGFAWIRIFYVDAFACLEESWRLLERGFMYSLRELAVFLVFSSPGYGNGEPNIIYRFWSLLVSPEGSGH